MNHTVTGIKAQLYRMNEINGQYDYSVPVIAITDEEVERENLEKFAKLAAKIPTLIIIGWQAQEYVPSACDQTSEANNSK